MKYDFLTDTVETLHVEEWVGAKMACGRRRFTFDLDSREIGASFSSCGWLGVQASLLRP